MEPTNPQTGSITVAWLVVSSLLAAGLLTFGTTQVVGLLAHEERTRITALPATGLTAVEAHTDSGRVEVVGADVDRIHVEARLSDGLRRTRYRVEVRGHVLRVRSDCLGAFSTWCSAQLRIVVPRRFQVTASSDGDSVEASGVEAGVDLRSSGGAVRATDVRGPVLLHTDGGSATGTRLRSSVVEASSDGGSVRIELAQAPTRVVARSDAGSVEVIVPDDGRPYAVAASTKQGSTNNAVRTDPTSTRSITATSDAGGVTVRYPR